MMPISYEYNHRPVDSKDAGEQGDYNLTREHARNIKDAANLYPLS